MLENFIFAALSITNSRSPKKHKLMFLWTTTWQLFYLQTRGLNTAVNTTKSLGLGLSSLVDQLVELIDYILSTILGFCSYLNYVSFFNIISHLFAELFYVLFSFVLLTYFWGNLAQKWNNGTEQIFLCPASLQVNHNTFSCQRTCTLQVSKCPFKLT